jgi:nucleoside-diphosphate-sugar epimerase
VNNNGLPLIQPIYIEDLIDYMKRLIDYDFSEDIFFLRGPDTLSVKDIILRIGRLLNKKIDIHENGKDSSNYLVDDKSTNERLKYSSKVHFDEGISRLLKSMEDEDPGK